MKVSIQYNAKEDKVIRLDGVYLECALCRREYQMLPQHLLDEIKEPISDADAAVLTTAALMEARGQGWKLDFEDDDAYCPECAEEPGE